MASKIQLRRDSSGNWSATNPVLAEGEMGVELDTNRSKLGDGTSNWNDIDYMTDTNAVGTYDAKYLRKDSGGGEQTVLSSEDVNFNGALDARAGLRIGANRGGILNVESGSSKNPGIRFYETGLGIHSNAAGQGTIKRSVLTFTDMDDNKCATFAEDKITLGDGNFDNRVKLLLGGSNTIRGTGGTSTATGYGILMGGDYDVTENLGTGDLNIRGCTSSFGSSLNTELDSVRHYIVSPGTFTQEPAEHTGF